MGSAVEFDWAEEIDAAETLRAPAPASQQDEIKFGDFDLPDGKVSALTDLFENTSVSNKGMSPGNARSIPESEKVFNNKGPKQKPKASIKDLSRAQQKIHKEWQKHAASTASRPLLRSFFGDNQRTTGATELRFKITDWINRPYAPPSEGGGTFPVLTYYLDVGRPFFADASTVAGEQFTRSKVRSVKLWFLSPPQAVNNTPLLQVLTAIPVKDENTGNALSLLGQSNTIIHPDVRQPWVMVGNWNWEKIFENSQYQPFEFPAQSIADGRDLLALFAYAVINAESGAAFSTSAEGSANLKLEVEVQAPIPLVPTPLRLLGDSAAFTQPPAEEKVTTDESPVQYTLKSIHRQM